MKWGRGSHQQCMDFLCEGYINGSTWTMKKSSWDKWDWGAWCEICKESIKEKKGKEIKLTLPKEIWVAQKFKVTPFEFRLCLKNKRTKNKTNQKTQTTTKTMRTSDWTTKKTASQVCSVREQEEQTLQSWGSPHLLVSHSMPESLKSLGPPTHRSFSWLWRLLYT